MRGGVKLGPTASKATTPQHSGQACKCSVLWCQTPMDPRSLVGPKNPPVCTAATQPCSLQQYPGGRMGECCPHIMQCKNQAFGIQPCSPADRADHDKAGHVHSKQNPLLLFFPYRYFQCSATVPITYALLKIKFKMYPNLHAGWQFPHSVSTAAVLKLPDQSVPKPACATENHLQHTHSSSWDARSPTAVEKLRVQHATPVAPQHTTLHKKVIYHW